MNQKLLDYIISLDLKGIAASYLFEKIADHAIPKIKETFQQFWKDDTDEVLPILVASEDEIIKQVMHNIKIAEAWCDEISFKDIKKAKHIGDIFIQLDFYLTPKRVHFDLGNEQRIALKKALKFDGRNFIILGGPGAGKTTLMKFITKRLLTDNDYFQKKFLCPFIIRLREASSSTHHKINTTESFYFILMEQLGIDIQYPSLKIEDKGKKSRRRNTEQLGTEIHYAILKAEAKDEESRKRNIEKYYSIVKRIIAEFIDEMGVLLVLDGFDEISSAELKKVISEEIRELSLSLKNSNFILTSRTGEFDYSIERTTTYEISSLTDQQIKTFIKKWINNKEKSNDLYHQIKNSPFNDMAIRPLNIAHLCAIYERYNSIPERPKSVYTKIIYLLLEEWDSQRSIERMSNYAGFSRDRKIDFLSKLSFILTVNFGKSVFTRLDLDLGYKEIHGDFELPIRQLKNVLDEIESHSGLFIQSGYDKYEFSHKSIQEYLCAVYFAKTSILEFDEDIILKTPNEFAIAVSIASNPNLAFASIIMSILRSKSLNPAFLKPFLNRLLIEKPDFTKDPTLACALSYMFSELIKNVRVCEIWGGVESYPNAFLLSEKSSEIAQIESLLHNFIGSHKNISKSFSSLRDIYGPKSGDMSFLRNGLDKIDEGERQHLIFLISAGGAIKSLTFHPKEMVLSYPMLQHYYYATNQTL